MNRSSLIALVLLALFFYGAGCEEKEKKKSAATDQVLRQLYEEYKFGQIEKCTYEGRLVYHAGINAYDIGTQVYDSTGKSIATCNYMTKMVDPPCEKLADCEVLYRCENHMSGEPAVNKLGFADSTKQE